MLYTPDNIKAAVDIISEYIREYETADTEYFKDIQADIICSSLSVLSAVTGFTYSWTRRVMKNGRLYSAVSRTENGEVIDIYDNCAISNG